MCLMPQRIKPVTPDTFIIWLDEQLKLKGWNDSKLAKEAGIAHSVISKARTGERNVRWDACLAIAQALNVPAEIVFRKAGLVENRADEDPIKNELIQSILHKVSQLTPDEQSMVDSLIETMLSKHGSSNEEQTPLDKAQAIKQG